MAREMIVAAAEAGADMVKFQSYRGAVVAEWN
jgi:sialic acid synthase SpsE